MITLPVPPEPDRTAPAGAAPRRPRPAWLLRSRPDKGLLPTQGEALTQQTSDVKVLFLAGKGRSGGTLLAALLGQLPGFFNIGELNRLWDWGLVENYKCGCGIPVQECPTWHEILDTADGLLEGTGIPPIAEGPHRPRAGRCGPVAAPDPPLPRPARDAQPLGHARALHERVVGCVPRDRHGYRRARRRRLVASPNRAGRARARSGSRRARRAAHPRSTRRRLLVEAVACVPDRDNVEYMDKFSASFSTASWLVRNLVVEAIRRRGPVEVVQYDELARDPGAVLRQLAAFVSEPAGDLEFLTSETATLAPTHSVGGNPVRMQSGAIAIKPDEEWRREHLAPRSGGRTPRSRCRCCTGTDCPFARACRERGEHAPGPGDRDVRPEHTPLPPMAPPPRPARLRSRGAQRRVVGYRPRRRARAHP